MGGEARNDFVVDSMEKLGVFFWSNYSPTLLSEENDLVADMRSLGKVSNVEHGEVHAYAANDRTANTMNEDVPFVGEAAVKAVGVADRNGSDETIFGGVI